MSGLPEQTNGPERKLLAPSGITLEDLQKTAQEFDQEQINQAKAKTNQELASIKMAQADVAQKAESSDKPAYPPEFISNRRGQATQAIDNLNQQVTAALTDGEMRKFFNLDDIAIPDSSLVDKDIDSLLHAETDLSMTFNSLNEASETAKQQKSDQVAKIDELARQAAIARDRIQGLRFAIERSPRDKAVSDFKRETLRNLTTRLQELNKVESSGTRDTSAEHFAVQAAIHGLEEHSTTSEEFDQYVASFDQLFKGSEEVSRTRTAQEAAELARLQRRNTL